MNAERIARALAGHKVGRGWIARCPSHQDRVPSLSICESDDAKLLIHCHAGCEQEQVIAVLRSRGLWVQRGAAPISGAALRDGGRTKARNVDAKRSQAALRLWEAAIPAPGTTVENYLRSRGLHSRPPLALRFDPELRHPAGGVWPAMIALVTRGTDAAPLAIHRTYPSPDGTGKAPITPPRMMLGPCRGGAVRLAPYRDVLMVGEGIETCLAAMQETGMPAWSALSTSGLCALDLPVEVREVIVLADGDDPGEAAACAAARKWVREGRRARIARPPRGLDFNDLLLRGPSHLAEGAA